MKPTVPTPVNVMPRGVLIAIGAAVLITLASVAGVRLSGVDIRQPDAPAVLSRSLRFDDGPTGSVLVIDAATGQLAMEFTGEQGFLRGTLRALARERKRVGAGAEQPFELVLRSDQRLTLSDPVTGQRIDLESFGPTNAGLFARMLQPATAHAAMAAPSATPSASALARPTP